MIYLSSRNLLFLKPHKTAGTSFEIALSCNAGPDDIVTPFGNHLDDEFTRIDMGGQPPVNWTYREEDDEHYRKKLELFRKLQRVGRLEEGSPVLYEASVMKFSSHMKPGEVVERCGQEFLDKAYYVTMCRHPFEQLVSLARWRARGSKVTDLGHWVDRILGGENPQYNHDYYYHDDQFLPDFVVRFENMTEDLQTLEHQFDLKLVAQMPMTKKSSGDRSTPAHDLLSKEQREKCASINQRLFDQFDYQP